MVSNIATDHEETVRPVAPLAYFPDAEVLSNSASAMKELADSVAGMVGAVANQFRECVL